MIVLARAGWSAPEGSARGHGLFHLVIAHRLLWSRGSGPGRLNGLQRLYLDRLRSSDAEQQRPRVERHPHKRDQAERSTSVRHKPFALPDLLAAVERVAPVD